MRALDEIQRRLTPLFKEEAFRKRGRSYNRSADGGAVQVVSFQMMQTPIGPPRPALIREPPQGTFWVNLGVGIPELDAGKWAFGARDWRQEYDCALRERLDSGDEFGGWMLDRDPAEVVASVRAAYVSDAMPFFTKYRGWESLLAAWESGIELPMFASSDAAALQIGAALVRRGERERGAAAIRGAYWRAVAAARIKPHPFHEYAAEVAGQLGVDLGDEPEA